MSAHNDFDESVDAGIADANRSKREKLQRELMSSSFFNLSGGIMKEDKQSSWSSIDDLLCKLMAQSSERRFTKHVDRNLDYLHTSLQLDMIRMVAEDIKPEKREHDFSRDRVVRSLRGTEGMPEPALDQV